MLARERKRQQRRVTFGWVMFFVTMFACVVVIVYAASIRSIMHAKIVGLESTRDELQSKADAIAFQTRHIESLRRDTERVLRLCRTAEDIPDLGGNRIVVEHAGIQTVRLYVPAGSHTLQIASQWKPRTPGTLPFASPIADLAAATDVQRKTWTVALLPASGYFLTTTTSRNGGAIQWELTSNHPDFETQRGELPVVRFMHGGSSYHGSGIVAYPNQLQHFRDLEASVKANIPAGVDICRSTMSGPIDEVDHQFWFAVRVVSDGPWSMAASDVRRTSHPKLTDGMLTYRGGGAFEILEVSNEIDATERNEDN